MDARATRFKKFATAILSLLTYFASSAFGQEEGSAPPSSPVVDRPIDIVDVSNFDAGQETPTAPITPAPAIDPYPDGPLSSRFLLGDGFGLRPLFEQCGLSFYASSTQFEQGVASGGVRQAFRWGGKFDMLAHVDSAKLGLWDGGMLDVFAESRLGQSVDKFAGVFSPTNLAMFFPVPDQQITAITGLKYTQAITDASWPVFR